MTDGVLWPTRFFVPAPKISLYLLDPSSEEGASKDRYFRSYGFDASAPEILEDALLRYATKTNFIGAERTEHGLKLRFDGPLSAPNGRDAQVLSVWQVDAGTQGAARFVTARPSRRR